MDIKIDDIKNGMPGISPIEGADLLENCTVMLHRSGHISPTCLTLNGLVANNVLVQWTDTFNDQLDRTYADHAANTERAAVCISVLLSKSITNYTVIMRSRKGTGFDYYLGNEDDISFQPKARLEVSGIEKESDKNTVSSRFKQKCNQVSPTDDTLLPAYISIVEFSNPKALFNVKEVV